jgi:hypothetical protein
MRVDTIDYRWNTEPLSRVYDEGGRRGDVTSAACTVPKASSRLKYPGHISPDFLRLCRRHETRREETRLDETKEIVSGRK